VSLEEIIIGERLVSVLKGLTPGCKVSFRSGTSCPLRQGFFQDFEDTDSGVVALLRPQFPHEGIIRVPVDNVPRNKKTPPKTDGEM